jgi:hypothetical protein
MYWAKRGELGNGCEAYVVADGIEVNCADDAVILIAFPCPPPDDSR